MLTNSTYYSSSANLKYFSSSQFKSFQKCEAMTMAEINGEWTREPSKAMLLGSYVDSAIEGSLDSFKEHNPEIYTKSGTLRAEFKRAEEVVDYIESQPLLMEYLTGEKQTILTGKISGVSFKARLDVLHPDRIVDLKTTGRFAKVWSDELHSFTDFISAWRYDIQLAIYQELYRQTYDDTLPCYIVAVTTEPIPDSRIILLDQAQLDWALEEVELEVNHFMAVKFNMLEPVRCERCDYCKSTRKVSKVYKWSELDPDMNPVLER